jgi:hypothetical protein
MEIEEKDFHSLESGRIVGIRKLRSHPFEKL